MDDRQALVYRPATGPELATYPELFPELGRDFEALGFRRAGGVVEDLTPQGLDDLVSDYEPSAQAGFRRWAHLPASALSSQDGTALALVGWFWDTPVIELVSILTDGRPVLTRAPWQVDPPWPVAIQPYWKYTDRRTEQLYDDVPGRSIDIVDSAEPATLWAAHQAHVGRVGGEQTPLSLASYCEMRNVMYAVNLRTSDRMNKLAHALVVAACLVAFVVAALVTVRADPGWLGLLCGMGCLVVLLPVATRLQWVLRHVRRLRVPYPLTPVS